MRRAYKAEASSIDEADRLLPSCPNDACPQQVLLRGKQSIAASLGWLQNLGHQSMQFPSFPAVADRWQVADSLCKRLQSAGREGLALPCPYWKARPSMPGSEFTTTSEEPWHDLRASHSPRAMTSW